jgi:hypothetical protein
LDLLQALRESMGFARPEPDDLVPEEELDFIPILKVVMEAGVDPASVERLSIEVYRARHANGRPRSGRGRPAPR